MSDKIKVTCPRCKLTWETTLAELEKTETIYREIHKEPAANKTVVKYRAKCPVDGTYIILEVEED